MRTMDHEALAAEAQADGAVVPGQTGAVAGAGAVTAPGVVLGSLRPMKRAAAQRP